MKIMSDILLTCSKASEYIERNRDHDLNFRQRIQLNMHLALCGLCRSYKHQSDRLHAMILQLKNSEITSIPDGEKVKINILQKANRMKD